MRVLLLVALLTGLGLLGLREPAAAAEPVSPGLLFGASEEIVRRALIPSERNAHGEVRLVRRGTAACLQTVLCSPALVRGVKAIERKEAQSWPAGAAGHEDSQRFLRGLAEATERALTEFAARADGSDARRKLMIELVSDGEEAFFAFYGIDVDTSEDRLDVTAARPFLVRSASSEYVGRAQRLQASEAFHLDGDGLEALFAEP